MLNLATNNKYTDINNIVGKAETLISALNEPQFSHLWQLYLPDIGAMDSDGRKIKPPSSIISCSIPLSQINFESKSNGIFGFAVATGLKFNDSLKCKVYNPSNNDALKYFQYWRNKQVDPTNGTVGLPNDYYYKFRLKLYDKLFVPTVIVEIDATLDEFKFDGDLTHDSTASKALNLECTFKLSNSRISVHEDLVSLLKNKVTNVFSNAVNSVMPKSIQVTRL